MTSCSTSERFSLSSLENIHPLPSIYSANAVHIEMSKKKGLSGGHWYVKGYWLEMQLRVLSGAQRSGFSLQQHCSGLEENDPRGSGTTRRCGLGVGVILLEEVCQCGGRL